MKKISRYLFLIFLVSSPAFSKGSDFIGCQGQNIGKNDGSVVDVARELSNADSRIKKLCETEFSSPLKQIRELNSICTQGVEVSNRQIAASVSQSVKKLEENLIKACEKLRAALEESKKYCQSRAAGTLQAQKNANVVTATEVSQRETLQTKYELNQKAKSLKDNLSLKAARASVSVYRNLPEFEEKNVAAQAPGVCSAAYLEGAAARQSRREGSESKDSKDPALDKIVESLQNNFLTLEKNNKNAGACRQLSSKKGVLEKISSLKKQNLWPNGKRAARALSTLSYNDCQVARELESEAKVAEGALEKLGGGEPSVSQEQKVSTPRVQADRLTNASGGSGGLANDAASSTGAPLKSQGGSGGAVVEAILASEEADRADKKTRPEETPTQRVYREDQEAEAARTEKTASLRKCGIFDLFARIQGKCIR